MTKFIYFGFVSLAFACLSLAPAVQAVVPPPDGGYANFTTAEGTNALLNLSGGAANTGVGWYALSSAGVANFNTGVGAGALALDTGDDNTALGVAALLLNSTGGLNTATGAGALTFNDTGSLNTADGAFALYANTTGDRNTAVGRSALGLNTTGNANTAVGYTALEFNTGDDNTAIGTDALVANTSGVGNTATGESALVQNTTGNSNTADGLDALERTVSGNGNTAVGIAALSGNTSGNNNVALGQNSGGNVTTANNVICIGNVPGVNVSDTCFVGNIRGVTTQNADAAPVLIDSNGQLGTANSSRRYKTDIEPIDKSSESILSLKPVSFRYKLHKADTRQFGLIAEDVAEVNRDLVIYGTDGKPFTVRYDAVNAMLLNEFLKAHRKMEHQEEVIVDLQKQVEALTAGLQKVSARIEANKPVGQTVMN